MSRSPGKSSGLSDKAWLMREASKITSALGQTLAPLCEVVLHDLTDPEHAIIQIENNLSGRSVGDSVTELGLARIVDPAFPEVIANYTNSFADGRLVKSTSIGLKDKSGKFVAAIGINVDIAYLKSISTYLDILARTNPSEVVNEVLARRSSDLSAKVLAFAAKKNRDPRGLTSDEKREILGQLVEEGEFERRGAAGRIAAIIGTSRSNVYYYIRKARQISPSEQVSKVSKSPREKSHRRRSASPDHSRRIVNS